MKREKESLAIFYQIVNAVTYLHQSDIAHRNLTVSLYLVIHSILFFNGSHLENWGMLKEVKKEGKKQKGNKKEGENIQFFKKIVEKLGKN